MPLFRYYSWIFANFAQKIQPTDFSLGHLQLKTHIYKSNDIHVLFWSSFSSLLLCDVVSWLLSVMSAVTDSRRASRAVEHLLTLTMVSLQVLRYLLPASGLPEQNDAHASGFNDGWLLGHSHVHLLPAHHAGLEQHRHRPRGESASSVK